MKATVFYYLSLPAAILLCASCAGLLAGLPAARDVPAGADAAPPPETRVISYIEEDVSLEETFDSGHWVTMPSGAEITIIGLTGRRANHGEAVREALADAARKAALYHGVHAESAAVLNQGSGALDYFSDFDYMISPANDHEAYIDSLVFDEDKDVLEKNGVVMVRARYSGEFDIPPYKPAVEDGIPVWVKNYTADIPGFLAGVGYSKNKGSLQKTHTASYEKSISLE